ncbi:UBX domain-containing protein 3 [Hypsizygus marmoreus]|uniref:UBX domain-containing protein 3 n=1 Tax=Hypsizygus marmoreus TaxID=39966 RepID=A0A369K2D3_HYPMA|nr:UBX domain-containing protein 3 [Hypsizygus marmoreus]
MSHLDVRQQQALAQFQSLTNASDNDVAISVLDSVGWDVQRAVDLVFESSSGPPPIPMQHFEIDESEVEHRRPQPQQGTSLYQLMRPLFSVFAVPLHILSNIFRFIFGILRIPIPQIRFSALNFYRPLPRHRRPSRGGPDRWVRELEEETGAVSIGLSRGTVSSSSTATDTAGPSNLTARPRNGDDGTKVLPDFTLGSYDEVLRICQRDARIGCIVLVSEEHDDVAEFKRSTLTDPIFVQLLHENKIVVWGGDVRDQEAWSAAEKLQATTYPFVAFLALQPRRNPLSSSSSRTAASPPSLTVLSRHQGPSISGGPTSAQTLSQHLTNQVLPRVTPYLERMHTAQRERERDRLLREEQDRAFRDSARRDRERIEARMEEERRGRDRRRAEEEEEQRRQMRELERKRREDKRVEWSRWGRRVLAGKREPAKGMRVAVRLPSGGRVIHVFDETQTLTTLYAFVDAQLVPAAFKPEDDPVNPPEGQHKEVEVCFEGQIAREIDGDWWGFQLATAYPRKEVPWQRGVRLADVESLRGGGQVVVEMTGNKERNGQAAGEDSDGYDTEDSDA